MTIVEPITELDTQFSSDDATPTGWVQARERLTDAQVYWLSTVRQDGRPHVTPLIAVWLEDSLFFCTGPDERKAKNLVDNPHCVLTTGCNSLDEGLDIVLEGHATPVRDQAVLRRVAETYESKYGSDWHFDVGDGAFVGGATGAGGKALVFQVTPATAFGFGRGDTYSQTRWRFADT